MRITCNGEPVELPEGATVADLPGRSPGGEESAPAGADGSAVAVNGRVVPRAEHARTRLSPGDRVERVRAVPGG